MIRPGIAHGSWQWVRQWSATAAGPVHQFKLLAVTEREAAPDPPSIDPSSLTERSGAKPYLVYRFRRFLNYPGWPARRAVKTKNRYDQSRLLRDEL
jgi:hypothetical protein